MPASFGTRTPHLHGADQLSPRTRKRLATANSPTEDGPPPSYSCIAGLKVACAAAACSES